MRKEFKLNEEQMYRMLRAMNPSKLELMDSIDPVGLTMQQTNDIWIEMGKEMNFKGMTAEPVKGKSHYYFTAEVYDETKH